MKAENIINLFDAAATPDISVTSPTEVSEQLPFTHSHRPLTLHSPLLHRSEPFSSFLWPVCPPVHFPYSILFYSILFCPSAPCLPCYIQLANEPSYSCCYQFDSPAVSSLLDMDLDSFSAAAKVSAVTQVDDSWHERIDRRDPPLQEMPSLTRDFIFYSEAFISSLWVLCHMFVNAEFFFLVAAWL